MITMLSAIGRRWRIAAAIVAVLAAALWHHGRVKAARIAGEQAGRTQVHAQWSAERERQHQAAARAAQQNQQKKEAQDATVITAQNQRASTSAADAAALRSLGAERDRLRHALDTALNTLRSCHLPGPAADAAAHRAAAIAAILAEMERAGAEMARAASGHAADSLMYQHAWPR